MIESRLILVARDLGRMPSSSELRGMGMNDLSCQIAKKGGFRAWARLVGFGLKDSETRLGQSGEENAMDYLRSIGFEVERQTSSAAFDLLVNGVSVDVKTGNMFDSVGTKSPGVRAWIFALNKVPATCDLYLLNCVDDSETVVARYFIPSSEAQIRTISIVSSGKGKYERFKDKPEEIRKLILKTF